jgi:Tol biopolymer transport system component
MSAVRSPITDEMIERMLRQRAAAPDDALMGDILRSAEALPQRRALRWGPFPIQRRTVVLLAAALLLALLAGAIAVASGIFRPDPTFPLERSNGVIVSAPHYRCNVVGIDPVGGEQRELVPALPGCLAGDYPMGYAVAWSADGSRMAYLVTRLCPGCLTDDYGAEFDEVSGVWLLDARSGITVHLMPCPLHYCELVDISSDGRHLAFTAVDATRSRLYLADANGTNLKPIELPGRPELIRFSPDGTRIVLSVPDEEALALYTVEADGSDLRVLFEDPARAARNPAWSPDSQRIVFDAGGATASIWVVDADGTDMRQLASAHRFEGPSAPAWSPDGSRIAYVRTPFTAEDDFVFEVWVMNADGGGKTRIYQSRCCISDWSGPVWSPDGEWIAFGAGLTRGTTANGLFVMHADGTELRRISREVISPAWQPLP